MAIHIGDMLVSSSGARAHGHAVIELHDLAYQLDRPSPPERPLGPRRPSGTRSWSVSSPRHTRLGFSSIGVRTTTSSPPDEDPTWNPMSAKPPWSPRDIYRPAARPPGYYAEDWPGWKPPVIKSEPPPRVLGAGGADPTTHLEKLVWVVLGGIGVLLLIAIFMRIGKPIGRDRRRVCLARPAPPAPAMGYVRARRTRCEMGRRMCCTAQTAQVATITESSLHVELADGDSELGALTRSTDTAASSQPGELHDDLPPPYSECVRPPAYTKEPPPPYAAPASHTGTKHVEPQVHTHRPSGYELINAGVKAE